MNQSSPTFFFHHKLAFPSELKMIARERQSYGKTAQVVTIYDTSELLIPAEE